MFSMILWCWCGILKLIFALKWLSINSTSSLFNCIKYLTSKIPDSVHQATLNGFSALLLCFLLYLGYEYVIRRRYLWGKRQPIDPAGSKDSIYGSPSTLPKSPSMTSLMAGLVDEHHFEELNRHDLFKLLMTSRCKLFAFLETEAVEMLIESAKPIEWTEQTFDEQDGMILITRGKVMIEWQEKYSLGTLSTGQCFPSIVYSVRKICNLLLKNSDNIEGDTPTSIKAKSESVQVEGFLIPWSAFTQLSLVHPISLAHFIQLCGAKILRSTQLVIDSLTENVDDVTGKSIACQLDEGLIEMHQNLLGNIHKHFVSSDNSPLQLDAMDEEERIELHNEAVKILFTILGLEEQISRLIEFTGVKDDHSSRLIKRLIEEGELIELKQHFGAKDGTDNALTLIYKGERIGGFHFLIKANQQPKQSSSLLFGSVCFFVPHSIAVTDWSIDSVNSATTINAITGFLSIGHIDLLVTQFPHVMIYLASFLRSSPLFMALDTVIDLVRESPGKTLSMHNRVVTILQGRLVGVHKNKLLGRADTFKTIEHGPGQVLGLREHLQFKEYNLTIASLEEQSSVDTNLLVAIRDTDLSIYPTSLVDVLFEMFPHKALQVMQKLLFESYNNVVYRLNEDDSNLAANIFQNNAMLSGTVSYTVNKDTIITPNSCAVRTVSIIAGDDHGTFHQSYVTRFAMQLRDQLALIIQQLQEQEKQASGTAQETLIPVVLLDSSAVFRVLGRHAFAPIGKLRLSDWFAEQEATHRIVLYLCDPSKTPWTLQCLRQSDLIMTVIPEANSGQLIVSRTIVPIGLGSIETWLDPGHSRHELVILHRKRRARGTAELLALRPTVTRHHHVHMPDLLTDPGNGVNPQAPQSMFLNGNRAGFPFTPLFMDWLDQVKFQVSGLMNGYYDDLGRRGSSGNLLRQTHAVGSSTTTSMSRSCMDDDISRIARHLLGRSVGLVLSGGGARGIAHLGMIEKMISSGVPLDIVCGTSMGAFVGALLARGGTCLANSSTDLPIMYRHLKVFCAKSSDYLRLALDLTYPMTSLLTGHALNRSLLSAFGQTLDIADLWIPYFCIVTNIATPEAMEEALQEGPVWRACRASMSLAGYFPPICRPVTSNQGSGVVRQAPTDNHTPTYGMLLDGGYMNNLPIDQMHSLYPDCSTIIAIDVGLEDDRVQRIFGDSVSGFWLMLRRLFYAPFNVLSGGGYIVSKQETPAINEATSSTTVVPYGAKWQAPSLREIQSRIAFATHATKKHSLMSRLASSHVQVHYLRPPVQHIATMEFASFERVMDIGRIYGAQVVQDENLPKRTQ